MFWIMFSIVSLLVLSGVVIAGLVAAALSKSTTRYLVLDVLCSKYTYSSSLVTTLQVQVSLAFREHWSLHPRHP
jgi:hypothetical protein